LPVLIAKGLEIDCIHGLMGSFGPRSGFNGFIGSRVAGEMELWHVGHVTEGLKLRGRERQQMRELETAVERRTRTEDERRHFAPGTNQAAESGTIVSP
jgi:hypothetical protein